VIKKYNNTPEEYRNYKNTVPFYARKSDAEIAMEQKKSGER
jgi:hypothetical protein